MEIAKVEIEVVKMTRDEQDELWQKVTSGTDIMICGRKMINWDTSDGNNMLLLQDVNGKQQWFHIEVDYER